MKKSMIAAMAACVMTLTGALAQEQTQKTQLPRQRPTPEQIAQKRTEMMTKRLDLDEAQTQKVYQVNLENAKLMAKHRVQMKAERQNEAEQMKGILTTDQFVKWSQLQASPARSPRHGKDGKECCRENKECRMTTRDCSARNAEPRKNGK